MKIALMDDVHLEFGGIERDRIKNTAGADVLILAGDITVVSKLCGISYAKGERYFSSSSPEVVRNTHNFFEIISEAYPHIIYVAGNHEFYSGGDFDESLDDLRRECAEYENIHFLEQESLVIDGVKFIGATLWTDCNHSDEETMDFLESTMNDFNQIYIADYYGMRAKITPEDTIDRHNRSLRYIEAAVLESEKDGINEVVVVTHHAPSKRSQHPRHSDVKINGGYSSDLSDFIAAHPQIKLWAHGHTHKRYCYYVGNTLIASNARGYADYEESELSFEIKVLDLSTRPSLSETIEKNGEW